MTSREPLKYFNFSFATPTQIIFGRGKFNDVPQYIKQLTNGKNVFVLTGKRKTLVDRLSEALGDEYKVTSFAVAGEPSTAMAKEATESARASKADIVIGLGGGSPVDLGKAVAMLVTNGGEPLDYMEVIGKGLKVTKKSLPYIAVPTTSGPGAEVTKNAVLRSDEHHVKVSLRALSMIPDIALVDPELVLTAPKSVTRDTGLDAFTQVVESFTTHLANPLTDAICREGLRYAKRSLMRVFTNPDDIDAREDMAIVSLFGGVALANAKLGAVHGFAGPLGGMFPNASHGGVCAALLPHVVELNVKLLKEREPENPALAKYDELGQVLTGRSDATAADAVAWINDVCAKMEVPGLSAYGIKKCHYEELITKSAKSSSMKGNPIKLTTEELEGLLTVAM